MISPKSASIIRWAPRILAAAYILLLTLFSLDVFESNAPLPELLFGFVVHSAPAIILLLFLIFSWDRPLILGILFLAMCGVFTWFFHTWRHALNLLLISGPLLVTAILFFLSHRYGARRVEPSSPSS